MFGWLRRLLPSEGQKWLVDSDGHSIFVTDSVGENCSVRISDLSKIVIQTNDSGPWGDDVWWLFYDTNGELACGYPQGLKNEKAVLDVIFGLPGLDENEVIRAMGCTQNKRFTVWRG